MILEAVPAPPSALQNAHRTINRDITPLCRGPEAYTAAWQVGIRIDESFIDRPILVKDSQLDNALILRMPGGRKTFLLTEGQWRAILSRSHPIYTSGARVVTRRGRAMNAFLPWTCTFAVGPRLPSAEDREVQELGAFLNSAVMRRPVVRSVAVRRLPVPPDPPVPVCDLHLC